MRVRRSEKVENQWLEVAVEVEIRPCPNVLQWRLGIHERHVVCGFVLGKSMGLPAMLFGLASVRVHPYQRQKIVHPICRPHRCLLLERSGYRPVRIKVVETIRPRVET